MTKYKRIVTKNGRIQYWIDGKMKSADIIPDDILHHLENDSEFETDTPTKSEEFSVNTKQCLFDDDKATRHKFLNGITVGLCETDYRSRTSGQIAYRINELTREFQQ